MPGTTKCKDMGEDKVRMKNSYVELCGSVVGLQTYDKVKSESEEVTCWQSVRCKLFLKDQLLESVLSINIQIHLLFWLHLAP